MRLSQQYQEIIKASCKAVFGDDAQVFVFGSRVDDTRLGGDIDLYIKAPDKAEIFAKKIRFLAKVKKDIGEQKIDVIFDEDKNRPIEQEAIKWGVPL